MRTHCPAQAKIWAMRAEDLHRQPGSFDVITCLWNVLGHVLSTAARVGVLRQFERLVSPEGRIFIDLNHRYNARHYGALATAARLLRDRVWPGDRNGDVRVTWNIEGCRISTTGHVFTHREVAALSRAAGLHIEKRFVIDYASGEVASAHVRRQSSVCIPPAVRSGGLRRAFSNGIDRGAQGHADLGDVVVRQPIEEGQRQCPLSYLLGDGQILATIGVGCVKGLPMHRSKIAPATDAPRSHIGEDSIAVFLHEARREPDHENEPADASFGGLEKRESEFRRRPQVFAVTGRPVFTPRGMASIRFICERPRAQLISERRWLYPSRE